LRKYSLGDIIHHVMRLMAEAPALKKVPITCHLPDEPVYVMVDSGQMQEVLANLLLNAAHACRDKGAIFVSTERIGDEVELTVRDTGQGMTSDVQSRAFEPFFTTKARGTGLGLSICRKAMEAHNGTIELRSEPAKGATVRLRLPCAVQDRTPTAETPTG
jgi:signal transduction histidine kinase